MTVDSWVRIGEAVKKYQERGYEFIDVPWVTEIDPIQITLPSQSVAIEVYNFTSGEERLEYPCLVGSGEQSLLSIREKLQKGKKYVCVTPCFRDEDTYDELHLPYFMKVELMWVPFATQSSLSLLKSIIVDVTHVMIESTEKTEDFRWVDTDEEVDLLLNGVEIGSYGCREHEGFKWVYGTGLAEPRFTQALSKFAPLKEKTYSRKDLEKYMGSSLLDWIDSQEEAGKK